MWLETLVRCTGIHNFLSSRTFTSAERQFLANGLRFIPTPPLGRIEEYRQQFLKDSTRGWVRFSRTLTNRVLYQDAPSQKLAKFTVPVANRTEHADDDAWLQHSVALAALDQYRSVTWPTLRHAVTTASIRERVNISRDELLFLRQLMFDRAITCKPADKNLGLALVDTTWYENELRRMLADTVTYRQFIEHDKASLLMLQKRLLAELKLLVTRHRTVLTSWLPAHAEQILKFLARRVTLSSMRLPEIYLLIKVHKPAGLCGRPIVPSMNWVTTPPSILVDHLLQSIMRDHPTPWLVKDTKSLINDLESLPPLPQRGRFITADIASLYTNIDTQMGLELVEKFLTQRGIPGERIRFVMDLLRFVMTNSYLSFKNRIYHQVDGTAMGTSCAPAYANIIVVMLEAIVLAELAALIYLYRRFLDDILAYVADEVADEFMRRMNSLHPKLRFEFVQHPSQAEFLDLFIYKGALFESQGRLDLRVHQKKMNLYLYLPYHSYHTDAAKRSFIQTELTRYIRNSSHKADYLDLKHVFYQRLRDRGYPHAFLTLIFSSIYYADRPLFLLPAKDLPAHPILRTVTPKSACLLKRIARAHQAALSHAAEASSAPPVFIVPYTPLSRVITTRRLLHHQWYLATQGLQMPAPIIAYQSCPSIMAKLVFEKSRLNRLTSKFDKPWTSHSQRQPQLTQSTLTQHLRQQRPQPAVAAASVSQPASVHS